MAQGATAALLVALLGTSTAPCPALAQEATMAGQGIGIQGVAGGMAAAGAATTQSGDKDTSCAKVDFEAVVDEAAGVLRDLNLKNKPAFQDKLRQLKDKRGWSHEAFLKEAAPFVRDDEIARLDTSSEDLLGKISSMGQEGADAKSPDCGLLKQLKGFMQQLVELQTKKWSYMFGKLDAELGK